MSNKDFSKLLSLFRNALDNLILDSRFSELEFDVITLSHNKTGVTASAALIAKDELTVKKGTFSVEIDSIPDEMTVKSQLMFEDGNYVAYNKSDIEAFLREELELLLGEKVLS